MKSSVETITPELAKLWLELNINNRKPKDQWVITLTRMLLAGLWYLNGDSIKFDLAGNLIDGQHRLLAIVKSGVTVQSLVVRGLARTDDDRAIRTFEDQLEIEGISNARVLGRAIGAIFRVRFTGAGKSWSNRTTSVEQSSYLKQHEGKLRRSIDVVGIPVKALLSREWLVAWHYLFSEHDEDMATRFVEAFVSGENLSASDPIFLLRRIYIDDLKSARKMPFKVKAGLVIKAWNALRSGSKPQVLKYSLKQESFPTIN